jgi:hypothetical protein
MMPLAPTTTLFGSPISQTPRPLTAMISAVDQTKRRPPPARANVPSRISGTAFPYR